MALSQLSVAQRGCITEGYASGLIHCGYGNVRGRQSSSLGRCVMNCGLAGWLAGWQEAVLVSVSRGSTGT